MPTVSVTSDLFWISAAGAALLDVILLGLLLWRIPPARFRRLRWPLAGTAAVVWGGLALVLVEAFWAEYYRYFYPAWLRAGGSLVWVPALYGCLALLYHGLAVPAPVHPVIAFSMCAGAESILEHLWGLYGLHILDAPMLQAASPLAILAFALPEYVFYWGLIILIAAGLQAGWERRPGTQGAAKR